MYKKYKLSSNSQNGGEINPKIEVLKSPNIKSEYNLGVFAKTFIQKGETVERVPFLEIKKKLEEMPIPLGEYVFTSHLRKDPDYYVLALGYGSIYNHSLKNNVDYQTDTQERFLKYIANRDIYPGEELFINYGPEHNANKY